MTHQEARQIALARFLKKRLPDPKEHRQLDIPLQTRIDIPPTVVNNQVEVPEVINQVQVDSPIVNFDASVIASAIDRMTEMFGRMVEMHREMMAVLTSRPPIEVNVPPAEVVVNVPTPSVSVNVPAREPRTIEIKHPDGSYSEISERAAKRT